MQRELLALVAEYDDWFFGEYVLLGQPVEPAPWLTWRIIRNRYFQKHGFDFSVTARQYVHASLERNLKRALKSLVDRGEVRRVSSARYGFWYMTPETYQKCEAARVTSPGIGQLFATAG